MRFMTTLCALAALVCAASFPAHAASYATMAQARAAHPAAHLSYRILPDGRRCWYAGAKLTKTACEAGLARPHIAKKSDRLAMAALDPIERAVVALCGSICPRRIEPWLPRPAVPHVALTAWYFDKRPMGR